jgi:choline dehydrogenase
VTDFDYIFVGAGSAVCALASRLMGSGRHRCCCSRPAASDRHSRLEVPIGYSKSFYDARVNWMYRTVPDPAARGRHRRLRIPFDHIRGYQCAHAHDGREGGGPCLGRYDMSETAGVSENVSER